jgi:hypothetical protein
MDSTTAAGRSLAWHRWLSRWTALSTLPALLAVPFWGVVPMAWTSAAITVVVLIAHTGHHATGPRMTVAQLSRSSRAVVLFSITFTLGWAVLADLSPTAAIVVALLAVATMPPSVARYRRLESADGRYAPPVVDLDATATLTALLAAPAQRMTDAQLCKAWRDSFTALEASRTAREMMMIVALRQSFLDVFGVRHPLAFQAWLASSPHAAGGPDRFLKKEA